MHTVHARGCKLTVVFKINTTAQDLPHAPQSGVLTLDHCGVLMMMLEMRYCADQAQWNEMQPIVGVGLINVTGLQCGHRYSFRVVAMNGVLNSVRKTRSELHTITVPEGTHARSYSVSTSCAHYDIIYSHPSTPPSASRAAEQRQRSSTFPRRLRSHAYCCSRLTC